MKHTFYLIMPSNKVCGGHIYADYFLSWFSKYINCQYVPVCIINILPNLEFSSLPIICNGFKFLGKYFNFTVGLFFCIAWLLLKNRKSNSDYFILTHFSTYILIPFLPKERTHIFFQGLEYSFIRSPILSRLIKSYIRFLSNKISCFASNPMLRASLEASSIQCDFNLNQWCDEYFITMKDSTNDAHRSRKYDLCLIFRKSSVKRPDLYINFLRLNSQSSQPLRLAIILVEPDSLQSDKTIVSNTHSFFLCPPRQVLKAIYSDSSYYLLLSDHEGFALPPVEAMCCGSVPIVRDSYGPRAYMIHHSSNLTIPSTEKNIYQTVRKIIYDSNWTSLHLRSLKISNMGFQAQLTSFRSASISLLKNENYCGYARSQ